MKSILLSVRPEWVAKILSGEKTVEIRKTAPKCELPVEVYVYCTKGKSFGDILFPTNIYNTHHSSELRQAVKDNARNGKVVAKFTLREVTNINPHRIQGFSGNFYDMYEYDSVKEILFKSCLDSNTLHRYGLSTDEYLTFLYAWHISDLEVFDEPRELKQFKTLCRHYYGGLSSCEDVCGMYENGECSYGFVPLARPPQSWQYVEVKE